ncbi:Csu type fimbrial protein [Sphingomonas sp.]
MRAPRTRRIGLCAFAIAASVPSHAYAQTAQSFSVSATVVPGCAVQGVAGSEWGRIDLGTVPGTTTGTIEGELVANGAGIAIECTPGTTASVRADGGEHFEGGARGLRRAGGGARIPYRLMLDGEVEWTTQAVALNFTASLAVQRLPLRASATLPGALAAGRYSDTVRVTISW